MREKNNIPTEEIESWDDGTYQTGAAQPGKGQSGLIAGLLAATIFLGGIASALGIMNIRLLRQLDRQKDPVLPVTADATGPAGELMREEPDQSPQVPADGQLQLQTGQPNGTHALPKPDQNDDTAAVTAEVTVVDSQGSCSTGTALILSADGYLLTNAHLTDSALTITVLLPDGRTVRAALVACDPYSDLAVVYVRADGLTAATFAPEGRPTAGEQIGPVFDAEGRVLGFRGYDLATGLPQAVPVAELTDIAAQLVEARCVSGRLCLGLQVRAMSHFSRQYWDLEYGIEITDSQVESLLPGDILLRLEGQAITTCHQLHRLLLDHAPGDTLELEIFRAGQRFTVTAAVITNP